MRLLLTIIPLLLFGCTNIFEPDTVYRYDGRWELVSAYTEYQKMVEYDNADEIIAVNFASKDTSLTINHPAVHAVDSVNIGDVWEFNAENTWLIVDKHNSNPDTVMYELIRHPQVVVKINYPVYQEDSGYMRLVYWSVKPMVMTYIDDDSLVLRTSGAYLVNSDVRSESQLSFKRPN